MPDTIVDDGNTKSTRRKRRRKKRRRKRRSRTMGRSRGKRWWRGAMILVSMELT